MKRITFDFDGTLNMEIVQEYAKSLIDRGVDVWICTARFEPGYQHSWGGREWSNTDVNTIAEKLGIKKIIYTNMSDKWKHLIDKEITLHLDNDNIEIELINEKSDIKGVLVEEGWIEKCEKILF